MAQLPVSFLRRHLVNPQGGPAAELTCRDQTERLNRKSVVFPPRGHGLHSFLFDKLPFPAMEIAVEALRRQVTKSAYNATEGIEELRQGICQFHRHFDNLNYNPSDVIVGSGSKELVMLLMLVFNGDILISSTSSSPYKAQAIFTGHTPVIIETCQEDSFRVTPESIQKVVADNSLSHNKLLILKNPCNTTGTYYNEDHLKKLADACRQHNLIVVSDENYARLCYHGKHTSLCQYYPEGTILCTGVSKWANVGGWRIGFGMYPSSLAHLLSAVKAAAGHSYSCAPAPMQYAFAEVLQNLPACEDYIYHTTRIMKAVGSFCVRNLQSVGVRAAEPTCSYYIYANFHVISKALRRKGVVTCEQMCDLMLAELSVDVLPRKIVATTEPVELTVSLCLANFDGTKALTECYRRGVNGSLDDMFVEDFCSTIHTATMKFTTRKHCLAMSELAVLQLIYAYLNKEDAVMYTDDSVHHGDWSRSARKEAKFLLNRVGHIDDPLHQV